MLCFVLASAFLVALAFGAADIPFQDVKAFIFSRYQNENTLILKELRLPRVLASALAGMALAVSGAYMQGMTRNALASPSLFGITAGASAVLALSLALFSRDGSIWCFTGLSDWEHSIRASCFLYKFAGQT